MNNAPLVRHSQVQKDIKLVVNELIQVFLVIHRGVADPPKVLTMDEARPIARSIAGLRGDYLAIERSPF